MSSNNPAHDPDTDSPSNPAHQLAQFGAGCFWGVELAFQRVEGVVKTEVGYTQGHVHNPNYELVCTGTTKHCEVVRVEFDPTVCPYTNLLSLFWARHDPTTLNRQLRYGGGGSLRRWRFSFHKSSSSEKAKPPDELPVSAPDYSSIEKSVRRLMIDNPVEEERFRDSERDLLNGMDEKAKPNLTHAVTQLNPPRSVECYSFSSEESVLANVREKSDSG